MPWKHRSMITPSLKETSGPSAWNHWACCPQTGVRHSARALLRETVLRIVRDPLQHRDQWQWAMGYWDYCDFPPESEADAFYDVAVETIRAAGFDPEQFRPTEPKG
jgi:hypothetical protein